jgi:hypothetical protein
MGSGILEKRWEIVSQPVKLLLEVLYNKAKTSCNENTGL